MIKELNLNENIFSFLDFPSISVPCKFLDFQNGLSFNCQILDAVLPFNSGCTFFPLPPHFKNSSIYIYISLFLYKSKLLAFHLFHNLDDWSNFCFKLLFLIGSLLILPIIFLKYIIKYIISVDIVTCIK